MEERRKISRVEFDSKGVIVDCETLEKIYAEVVDFSPLGVAVTISGDSPSLEGKDVIIVAETLIMYADVVREEVVEGGKKKVAFKAKKFTSEVLQYLFEHIAEDTDK